MDPITQTLLGAAAAQAVFTKRLGPLAALAGALGGGLPDLDVLIPPSDPAVPFEFHRHFTHALLFIPVGGAAAAGALLANRRWWGRWRALLGAALVGCATHGLLDTCTTYGTYLLWPFLERRLAWDLISIIDPIFTLALLVGVAWTLRTRSATPARIALGGCVAYLCLGVVQHGRSLSLQDQLAERRGHEVVRGRAMPTLGNLIVWRSVYEAEGSLWADAMRGTRVREGSSVPLATLGGLPPETHEVASIFFAFTDGYAAQVPGPTHTIGDMRYSLDAAGFVPLWGIRLETGNPGVHLRWVDPGREESDFLGVLWREITSPEGFVPLASK
jgi:inner membrane protein